MFIIFKKRMGIFTAENFYSSDFKLNVKFKLILNAIRISLNVFILLVVFFTCFFL